MASVEEIARGLRVGFAGGPASGNDAIHAYLSDEGFEVTHVPPSPMDGRVRRDQIFELGKAHTEVFPKFIEDYRWDDVAIEVQGDEIVLTCSLAGTLPGGVALDVPVRMIWTVEDGYIARMESHVAPDPETVALMMAAMSGSGISPPQT